MCRALFISAITIQGGMRGVLVNAIERIPKG